MMNRREFLQLSVYMAFGLKMGLMASSSAAASSILTNATSNLSFKGSLIAAAMNPKKSGPLSLETHDTVLAHLDLETGKSSLLPIDLFVAHDALKVKENYLILPNAQHSTMRFTNLDGEGKTLSLNDKNKEVSGHGFFDEDRNAVIVTFKDNSKDGQGGFAILDPDDYRLLDTIYIDGYDPHDIQLLNEDTLAVCTYNLGGYGLNDNNFVGKTRDGYSYLSLYDRKTFKLKDKIPAYKNAMISHACVTKDGDLFAVGYQEYMDDTLGQWNAEYIEDKFQNFYAENHPELSKQWPNIAQSLNLHRVEKSINNFGLPLLPLKLANGSKNLDVMHFDNFHHRRAQSICYNRHANTICMAFPFSDSLKIYNATTHKSFDIYGKDLNLKEMRGITEIEGTPYLAVAGIRRGITIINSLNAEIVQHYDVKLGRIIHMHHIV